MGDSRKTPGFQHFFGPGDNGLAEVVNGQVVIDALLDLLIQSRLRNPSRIDISRMQTSLKIKLASALGLVGEEFERFLLRLNSLRNKFAHDLDYSLSKDEAYSLFLEADDAGCDLRGLPDKEEAMKEMSEKDMLLGVYNVTCAHLNFTLEAETGKSYMFADGDEKRA